MKKEMLGYTLKSTIIDPIIPKLKNSHSDIFSNYDLQFNTYRQDGKHFGEVNLNRDIVTSILDTYKKYIDAKCKNGSIKNQVYNSLYILTAIAISKQLYKTCTAQEKMRIDD